MYLMYVDESGDAGAAGSSYFALSALVIHDSQWRTFVTQMLAFRRSMKVLHGIPIRSEIHAYEYIRKPPVPGMKPHERIAVLRNFLDEIAKQHYISITNIVVTKAGKPSGFDVLDVAWRTLFQRFENTLTHGNFPGSHQADYGLVFTDATNGKKLAKIMRRMSVYNPIPSRFGPVSRNIPILRVIEDPHPKDSKHSYFIQAADVCAYFLMQRHTANKIIRKNGATRYFDRLAPVLNKYARPSHPLGIVGL